MHLFAQEVLYRGVFKGFLISKAHNPGRDGCLPSGFWRSPSPLTTDNLEGVVAFEPNHNRLQDAVDFNARGEFGERCAWPGSRVDCRERVESIRVGFPERGRSLLGLQGLPCCSWYFLSFLNLKFCCGYKGSGQRPMGNLAAHDVRIQAEFFWLRDSAHLNWSAKRCFR